MTKKTKATKVFDAIREEIHNGKLPAGSKLPMEFLKDRYEVGFSPIREALSRLVSIGLVHQEELRGFSVASLSLEDFYDLYHMRKQLEGYALELSIKYGKKNWEDNIHHAWQNYKNCLAKEAFSIKKFAENHQLLRECLVEACDSYWLFNIRAYLFQHAERYRQLCFKQNLYDTRFRKRSLEIHEKLVKATLARQTKSALKHAAESWDLSIETIANVLKRRDI